VNQGSGSADHAGEGGGDEAGAQGAAKSGSESLERLFHGGEPLLVRMVVHATTTYQNTIETLIPAVKAGDWSLDA
jgi:hypothetical protein